MLTDVKIQQHITDLTTDLCCRYQTPAWRTAGEDERFPLGSALKNAISTGTPNLFWNCCERILTRERSGSFHWWDYANWSLIHKQHNALYHNDRCSAVDSGGVNRQGHELSWTCWKEQTHALTEVIKINCFLVELLLQEKGLCQKPADRFCMDGKNSGKQLQWHYG